MVTRFLLPVQLQRQGRRIPPVPTQTNFSFLLSPACQLYTPWRVPAYLRPYYLGQQSCNLTAPADLKLYLDAAGVWTNCAASDPTFAGSPHCPICTAAIYRAAIMVRRGTKKVPGTPPCLHFCLG